MSGFYQLVEKLEKIYPDDWWIARWRESTQLNLGTFPQVEIYENALRNLDNESCLVLYEKVCQSFREPMTDRGKHEFFNFLNEALAYEYLVASGFSYVRLLPAKSKGKTPDIEYKCSSGVLSYCEVKTISISNDELVRTSYENSFDTSIYSELNEQFLKKLDFVIRKAESQIHAAGSGFVYIIVHFDDFVQRNYGKYKSQITTFLTSSFPDSRIVLRVGISGEHYISYGNNKYMRESN
jgi:hypothetical protein